MASKVIYPVVAAVGIATLGAAAWWYQNQPSKSLAEAPLTSAPAPGPQGGTGKPSVEVARVEIKKLVDDAQAVGSLRSRQGVVLRPEISGRITQLNFRDGDRVKAGQLLVQLDDRLPMAQVQQAQAELSIAVANHKRNQDLVEQNFISRRTVDESAAALQVGEAKLALAHATAARLKILAPFDGLAGIRLVNVGDYLKDGADIVNIEDIEAIFVDYRLPERFQSKVRRGQTATVELDALPGRKFTAVLQAIDPLIDANGRSVGVRACIDNRRLQLRPGMFARVNTVFGQRDDARVIPEEAIVPQAGKQFVIKLLPGPDAQGFVTQRVEVKVGQRMPGKVEILDGLAVGDTVVTAGQQRVQRDGSAVRVLEIATAPAGPAPTTGTATTSTKPPANAMAPLTGPDPCRAGMTGAANPSAKPTRKPTHSPA
ncbi:MAG: efflux RND transporter periplasmic adaptor subunit [Polaromonas sp.]|jgi:membrane fusion protein (multidrug efflux system)|nr:efflux RND transporter periplasmic adaptor subunit [Polaromonas sp.]